MSPHRRPDCSFSLEHHLKQQRHRAANERFPFTGGAWHLSPGIAWLVFQIRSPFPNLGLSLIGAACPECLSSTCPLRFFQGIAWYWEGQSLLAILDFVSSSPRSCYSLRCLPSSVKGAEANIFLSHYFKFAKLTSKIFKSDFWNTLPVFILDSEGNTLC